MGILYLVATPIGNLEDMTLRGLRVLEEVDLIASEDTRQSIKLLNHYNIKNKLVTYQKHNEQKATEILVGELLMGKNIALISDAGMPLVSDPGSILVEACISANIKVEVVPGANAALCGLVLSGMGGGPFTFLGFLGKQNKDIKAGLDRIKASDIPIILYESPHRLTKTLAVMEETFPNRRISISREITKKFEATIRGTASELKAHFQETQPRGEFVMVIDGCDENEKKADNPMVLKSPYEQLAYYMEKGMTEKDAMKEIAKNMGISKREVYKILKI